MSDSILTPVSADVINSNFTALENLINTERNFLTPNAVNGGALSSGNPNILSYSGNVVTLATNTTYTDYLRISSTTNSALTVTIPTSPVSATWNLYIENGALVAYNNATYVQRTQPSGSTNAVWFDTSKEPVVQYKWDNTSAFATYTGVFCGQAITNGSGAVSGIVQPKFNENGYVANKKTTAKQAMPSDSSYEVTLASYASNASGTFTAPANGYFCISSNGSPGLSISAFIYMENGCIRTEGLGNQYVALNVYLPCRKGQTITYGWWALTANAMRGYFTYAEGEI